MSICEIVSEDVFMYVNIVFTSYHSQHDNCSDQFVWGIISISKYNNGLKLKAGGMKVYI